MKKDEILDLLVESGLEAYKDRFDSLIFPSYQIQLEPEEDSNIAIGASKIGGQPDLDIEVEWPRWKGYNMSFVAQINLSDLPDPILLPPGGLLSFFYAVEPMYEDEDFYSDPNTCHVIYTPVEKLSGITRKTLPELSEEAIFRPNRAMFSPALSVPAAESAYLESMGLGWNGNREHFKIYWEVFLEKYREMNEHSDMVHRLLGHPEQIQGDMQVACEVKSIQKKRKPASCLGMSVECIFGSGRTTSWSNASVGLFARCSAASSCLIRK